MEPLIFDTTVWIDFLNAKVNQRSKLLSEYISNSYPHYLCPDIVRETLQGIREDKVYEQLKPIMLSFDILVAEPLEVNIGAAEIYRGLRKKGVTIKNTSDCIIAWYAIKNKLKIVHSDSDFEKIAAHTALRTYKF